MLVLLPPSEGKASRRRGTPVVPRTLSRPELTDARLQVLDALEKVSAHPDALELLDVGASLAAEVERSTRWRTEPALPASALYTGVLYDALDWPTLPAGAKRRAASRLLVVSAAWGVLAPGDRVPPYRLSMGVDLPGPGPLAAFWRQRLTPVLDPEAEGRVVVDCRSATYAAAWRPDTGRAAAVVAVRVLRESAGRRSVVSHMAKHTRGLVARHLLTRAGRDPRTAEQLAAAVGERYDVELTSPARDRTRTLDVVVRD
ncbi:YaaA family protein [Thalassiella azotivora]